MGADIELVDRIMKEFAELTGLHPVKERPRRYLWTDAFAVCNFLELYRCTKEERHLEMALALVDQVHLTLGRHRPDDRRSGWISGLGEEEAREHPTRGGLRIGKPLRERGASEPPDDELEWDQDGQYYHYLTKWMHALGRVCSATGEPKYTRWGIELAKAAHAAFAYTPGSVGRRRLYWKMSIDLSRPLVRSMGLHDPLDGYVTYLELQTLTSRFPSRTSLDLRAEMADMAGICKDGHWVTDDPLGIGGLLFDASRIANLMALGAPDRSPLLKTLLDSALPGVESFSASGAFRLPAQYRLAFRELGLCIGLRAIERLNSMKELGSPAFLKEKEVARRISALLRFAPIGVEMESFWMVPSNQRGGTWLDHQDINAVMLATSLAPDSFLSV